MNIEFVIAIALLLSGLAIVMWDGHRTMLAVTLAFGAAFAYGLVIGWLAYSKYHGVV